MRVFNHRNGEYLQVDSARIYYEQQGNASGPALVLLHGGLGDLETFNALASALGSSYRLIGIDSRGQGSSTLGDAPLTYKRIQQDVEAVIRHLRLNQLSIIGHSDGGVVALRLAAGKTLPIDKLVTIGAHWTLQADDPTRQLYAGITAADWREMFPQQVARYQALNPQPHFEQLIEAVRQLWLDDSENGYPNESVSEITQDLLVIRGEEDQLVSRSNAIELADRVQRARLLNIPFVGHSAHETHPHWLLPILEVFLRPTASAG